MLGGVMATVKTPDALYVWIPNWFGKDGFQHYKDRDPIWVKNYTRLLSHDEYLSLSSHLRGVLHGLWLSYASSDRRLRADTRSLSSRLAVRVMTRDLEALSHAGFIEIVDSSVLSQRLRSRAPAPSQEEERPEEPKALDQRHKPKAVSERTNGHHPQPPLELAPIQTEDPDADIDFNGPAIPQRTARGMN